MPERRSFLSRAAETLFLTVLGGILTWAVILGLEAWVSAWGESSLPEVSAKASSEGPITDDFAVTTVQFDEVLDEDKTYVSIFTCETTDQVRTLRKAIAESGNFGKSRLVTVELSWRAGQYLKGAPTVVYDERHRERFDLGNLLPLINASYAPVPVRVIPNDGDETEWALSIFVC